MDPARENSRKAAISPKERPFPTRGAGKLLTEPGERNCIARDTRITGNIKARADVFVDGEVNGNVHTTGNVIQSKLGTLRGEIVCVEGNFHGTHDGSLKAFQKVRLGAQSSIKSKIVTAQLIIEAGASFYGSLKLINEAGEVKK